MAFTSGPIDDECPISDFLYCPNQDCKNKTGYDPADFVNGVYTVVVKLGGCT